MMSARFGQKGANDFTTHEPQVRDKKRESYIKRHQTKESKYWDFNTIDRLKQPSFLSRYILWEKPSLKEAGQFLINKFPQLKEV